MLHLNKHTKFSEIIKRLCFFVCVLVLINVLCPEKAFCQLTEEQAAKATKSYSEAYKKMQNKIKKIENPNYELGTRAAAMEIKHHSKRAKNALDDALKDGEITEAEYRELIELAKTALTGRCL